MCGDLRRHHGSRALPGRLARSAGHAARQLAEASLCVVWRRPDLLKLARLAPRLVGRLVALHIGLQESGGGGERQKDWARDRDW